MRELVAIAALTLVWAVPASAWQLDFEDPTLAAGSIVDEGVFGRFDLGDGITAGISAWRHSGGGMAPNPAVVFDTNNPTGGDNDLGAPFAQGPGPHLPQDFNHRPDQVLILHENLGTCSATVCTNPDDLGQGPAGGFDINFNRGVILDWLDFFDIETGENGSSDMSKNGITLYGDIGQILHTTFTPFTGGDNTWDRRLFVAAGNTPGIAGVHRMEIRLGGSGAIDNLTGRSPPTVPEPATWLLLLLGLAALAYRQRFGNPSTLRH